MFMACDGKVRIFSVLVKIRTILEVRGFVRAVVQLSISCYVRVACHGKVRIFSVLVKIRTFLEPRGFVRAVV